MIEKLPSMYSNENPPYMHQRMMWDKINQMVELLNFWLESDTISTPEQKHD